MRNIHAKQPVCKPFLLLSDMLPDIPLIPCGPPYAFPEFIALLMIRKLGGIILRVACKPVLYLPKQFSAMREKLEKLLI